MQNDLVELLRMKVDDVVGSAFVLSFNEQPKTELIDDTLHMEFPASGMGLRADSNGRVTSVFLHSEGLDGYREFAGALPEGISFSSSRSDIHNVLGEPSASGGGTIIQLLGKAHSWDRYDRDAYSVHIEYAEGDEAIRLVTLMRPDSLPR